MKGSNLDREKDESNFYEIMRALMFSTYDRSHIYKNQISVMDLVSSDEK